MTTVATARVWLALGGVVVGILYSQQRLPARGAMACIVIGVACAWTRRDRIVGMVGILFVTAGLAAFNPVAPTPGPATWGGAVTHAYRDSLKSALEAAPERPRGLL
ncbi:MAG: hypothetical protein KY391_07120, partial [Actinobacteria bacterium]|nr:hypothetical protein [Actinomycetota bacterium]